MKQVVDNVIKNALLQTMDELHRVCEENNLKYFLIGGSLIGAVRHKGCIPWDDDIDVVMRPSDFKRLLELRNKFGSGFSLHHRSFDESISLPIARVENSYVIVDEGYYSGVKTGVFVDVFCFNETFNTKVFQIMHFKIVAIFRLLMLLKYRSYSKRKYSEFALKIINIISIFFNIFPKKILSGLMDSSEALGRLGGKKVCYANLHGVWKTKEIAPIWHGVNRWLLQP